MIFISYSHKNNREAADIKDVLEARRFQCFLAHHDVTADEDWHDEIWQALRNCHAFLGVLTAEFNASAFCQQEMGAALALEKPRLLVRLGSDTVPGFAARFQAIAVEKLKSTVEESRKFRQVRVETWITETESAGSFAEANALFDRFSKEWSSMTDDEKLRWLLAAASTSQVRSESYRVGPFYRQQRGELEPLLTDHWLFEHDKRSILHDIEANPVGRSSGGRGIELAPVSP